MKRSIKALGVCLLAGAAAVTVTGCGKVNKDYDVYFFNQKSEIADSLNDLADEYEAQTGKKVKVFTVGTTEGSETMRSELKSKEYPTLFSSNAISFEEWKSAGYAAGVEEISNPELKTLYESVPDALKLQFESEGNYGIPYNIEGYGLIADRQMLEDILGVTDLNAFTADYKEADYNQVMTTIDEFNKITQTMYDKGYVMVSIKDMATVNEDGTMSPGEILLPEGKIPFVLSQDDVCYYHYMDGDGFASKLVVDDEGKIRNEYIEDDGSVSVGDYDMVPLIDRFVEEHPDFSYRGAKGIVALTGYNGILGYRTDISYETRPADLDDNKVEWLDAHPDFSLDKEREEAKKVADAMKEDGWLFASHTWGHQNIGQISLEQLQADTQEVQG